MALRIGLPSQTEATSEPTVLTEESPAEMPVEEQMEAIPADMSGGGGMVEQEMVHYRGPERIDMACKNCIHFLEPNSCEVVAGVIDPDGTCNLFVQDSVEEVPMEEPMEASMPEMPVEPEIQ